MQKHNATEALEMPPVIQPAYEGVSPKDTVGDLFQTAVLLLGDEQAAALVVELVVTDAAIDPCADLDAKGGQLMEQVIAASLIRLGGQGHSAMVAPEQSASSGNSGICIESDDLSASGMSSAQLQAMVEGPGRADLRRWLEQLAPSLRAVFVLRAILGRDTESIAAIFEAAGARSWTSNQISLTYRQALCSLATSLVNSTHSHLVSQ